MAILCGRIARFVDGRWKSVGATSMVESAGWSAQEIMAPRLANKLSSSGLDMREFEPKDAQVACIGFPNPIMWDDRNG